VTWRAYGLAIVLAVVMGVLSVAAAITLDLPLRDPEGFLGPSWVRLPLIVLGCFAADVVPRVLYRTKGLRRRGAVAEFRSIVRERWTRGRVTLVVVGLGSFYLTYVGYRNLKSFLPFVRENNQDEALASLDRWLGFGNDPATLLHSVLGTGISAHVLSFVYVGYLIFVPVSVAAWLVWSRNLAGGLWYCTALCLNWVLGLVSYYVIPSMGPAFVEPSLFWNLPDTGVSALQTSLWNSRWHVITDPHEYEGVFGIAGFASLHVSVVFSAALMAHMAVKSAWIRAGTWTFLGLTILATIYFGWHYIADDLAGLAIGWVSVWLAAKATGHTMGGNYRGQIFGPGQPVEDVAPPSDVRHPPPSVGSPA
jgi:PAP2 superfamily